MSGITDGFVNALYLSENITQRDCCDHIEKVTPLAEFGVVLQIIDNEFECFVEQPSHAKYRDGLTREWQEDNFDLQPVREEAYKLWLANTTFP